MCVLSITPRLKLIAAGVISGSSTRLLDELSVRSTLVAIKGG
jgi:hypothetical protein